MPPPDSEQHPQPAVYSAIMATLLSSPTKRVSEEASVLAGSLRGDRKQRDKHADFWRSAELLDGEAWGAAPQE